MPAHTKVYFYLSKVNFRKLSLRFDFVPCHRNFSALCCSMFNRVEKLGQKNGNNNKKKKQTKKTTLNSVFLKIILFFSFLTEETFYF